MQSERNLKMRREKFTMERNILEVGDVVDLTEGRLPRAWYYTAEPAAAMSVNIDLNKRIKSSKGTVVSKVHEGASYTIEIEVEE